MMKVIHLIDSGGYFGAERVLVTLAIEQQLHGYDVSVVSCGAVNESEKPFEFECRKAGLNLLAWRGKTLANLYQLIKNNPHAIFHSHGYKFNILLALFRMRFWRVLVVATVHGYTSAPKFSKLYFYYLLNKFALKGLSGSVFVSQKTAQDSAARLNGKRLIIYNGIAELPSTLPAKDVDEGLDIGNYLIGVGRLSAEKAYDDLVKAFIEVAERHPEISLLIVGDGSERGYLEQIAVGSNRIHFLGHKANPLPYIERSRMLVISSRSEGLPIVLLEAMRSGIDVVSSRVGAIPDVIENGVSGLLYDAGNINQLADCINSLLAMKKGALGEAARARFINGYTSEKMFLHYDSWYRSLS